MLLPIRLARGPALRTTSAVNRVMSTPHFHPHAIVLGETARPYVKLRLVKSSSADVPPITRSFASHSSSSSNRPSPPRDPSTSNTNTPRRPTMSYSNADTGSKAADPYKAKNEQDPSLAEKIQDLSNFVDKSKFCMMTTRTPGSDLLASRCMSLAAKAGNGADYIFHSNSESGKTDDLKAHPDINLGFLTSAGEWASISGKASVISDRSAVHEYYSPALKAWLGDLGDGTHDGGPDDPRIVLIKVEAVTASYAVSGKNILASAFDVAKGIVTGEVAAINKLRHLSEQELQQVRSGSA